MVFFHLSLMIYLLIIINYCCLENKSNSFVVAFVISRDNPATTAHDSSSTLIPDPTLPSTTSNDNEATGKRCSIEVIPVEDYSDIMKLADLRYNEFISEEENTGSDFISNRAFRKATVEVHRERTDEGATVFLATINENGESIGVGAAEASPIEFQEAVKVIEGDSTSNSALAPPFLYVTDVVTCSKHRRMGIGNALMEAIEKEATKRCHYYHGEEDDNEKNGKIMSFQNTRLFLHVKTDNDSALQFYKNPKLGYGEYDESDNYYEKNSVVLSQDDNTSKIIKVYMDSVQLAKNADTEGQILLSKKVENLSFSGSKISSDAICDHSTEQSGATVIDSSNSDDEIPTWIKNELEANSDIIEDNHLQQLPIEQYPTIARSSINTNNDDMVVPMTDSNIILELLNDTGAQSLDELLQLSEEEIILIMNNILQYPILKQGKALCHWLKLKETSRTM